MIRYVAAIRINNYRGCEQTREKMLPIGANLIVSGYQRTICFLGNCCKNVTRYISLFNDLDIAKRSCTHFAGGMGTPCSNKDWTAQGLRIRFAPCRCAAADEGQDSAARTKVSGVSLWVTTSCPLSGGQRWLVLVQPQ